MAYVQRLQVRFDDVDYARIVFYPRLFAYCHWVFEDFFRQEAGIPYAEVLTERKVGFPVVSAKADFQSPLRFGDTCRVVLETVKVGRRSIVTRYRLYLGDTEQLCAQVEVVAACIDITSFKAIDVPEFVRQPFLKHLASGAAS